MSDQPPAPTMLRRSLRVAVLLLKTVGVLVPLLILLYATDPFILALPVRLLTGWIWYLKRVTAQISFNRELMLSSAACLLIAMVLLQCCMTWLCTRRQPRTAWRWKNTVAVTLLVMVLFGASIAGTGIGHQLAWLGKQPLIQSISEKYRFVRGSRTLAQLLRTYAEDHDGKFPASLESLVPDYLENEQAMYRLMLWSSEPGADLESLTYLGQRLTEKSPDHLPMLVSPRRTAATGKWLVTRINGMTESVPDEEFDRLMDEWRRTTQAQSAK